MNTQQMFEFTCKNPRSGESIHFLGQGATVAEAVSDGVKNLQATYRPSSDGKCMPKLGIGVPPKAAVFDRIGRPLLRQLEEFERL